MTLKVLEVEHGQAIASSCAGTTTEECSANIQAFKKLPMPSCGGMLRGDGATKE